MKKDSSAKAVKTIGVMAVIIFCAKLLGLVRETMIAGVYGQGYASDVINTSSQIPLLFFDMTLGVAILSTFVPIFNKRLEQSGKEAAMNFAGNFMTVVTVIASAMALIGMVFAKQLVHIMVPGYESSKVAETAAMLRILFPSIAFTAAAYTAVGILQSFGEFNIPSVISVVSNLIMIVYLLVFRNRFGLWGVAVSMLAAWASQLFIQIPYLAKKGYVYKPTFNLKDSDLCAAAKLAVPVLISSWVQPLCTVINMAFGSALGDGAVSGLNWANKIYIIMVGVFAYAITNFIFPKLSRMGAGADKDGFSKTTRLSLGWAVFIIAYVSAMFIALNEGIIKTVFERGAFTADNTKITANALFYYSFGMVGYAICEVLNKSFYALGDGKTPMFASVFGVAVNFAAAFLFIKVFRMGIGGLALASAVSSVSIAAVLLYRINKKASKTADFSFFVNLVKILACGALAATVARILYTALGGIMGENFILTLIRLAAAAAAALVAYAFCAALFRVDEIKQFRRLGGE